jgi:NADP-dependent 3-hydroxy acid dehydrogenase YdfG
MNNYTSAITGASSGIGRSIALKLAENGISLALFARREDKLKDLQHLIKKENPSVKVIYHVGDIRDQNSIDGFFNAVMSEFGKLDLFINNAGIVYNKKFSNLTNDEVNNLIETNYNGSIRAIYRAVTIFEKNQRGVLVNISSTTALKSYPDASLYASTKAGVYSLIRSLQDEYLNNKNIKLLNIIPGATYTDFLNNRVDQIDINNIIQPENIADLVIYYLKSPDNIKITEITVRQSGRI